MADENKKERSIADEMDLMEDLGSGPHYLRNALLTLLIGVAALAVVVMMFFTERVEPWEVGLRYWYIDVPLLKHHQIPPEERTGVEEKFAAYDILPPGYRLNVPFITEVFTYDRSVQRLDLPLLNPTGEADVLRIRTSQDSMEFDVYATILYRIDTERVRGIMKNFQTMEGVRDKGVKAEFRGRLWSKLCTIETFTEFYGDAALVRTKAEEAKREMNEYFKAHQAGITISEVLIWDYRFPSDIEASIISKVVAIEKIEMEKALSREAENRAAVERSLAEADAAYEQELARGQARSREIEAEAQAEYDAAVAMGQRKILEAKAAGLGRINEALSRRGGRTYVGLEYAEALKGLEAIILPAGGAGGVNPLDIDKTIRQLTPAGGGSMEVVP